MHAKLSARRVAIGVLPCVLLVLAGCGSGVGDVTGKVTHQQKTVCSGQVMLLASNAKAYYAQIGADGTYSFSGIPVGEAKLAVTSPDPRALSEAAKNPRGADERRPPPPDQPAPPPVDAKKWFAIPDRYSDYASGELQLIVRAGANPHNIELKP